MASLVQHATGEANSALYSGVSLTGVAAGNALVAVIGSRAGVDIDSVSDSVNGTYTRGVSVLNATASRRLTIYYFTGSSAGNPTLTVDLAGTEDVGVDFFEASGASPLVFDTSSSYNSAAASSLNHQAGSITTGAQDGIVFAGFQWGGNVGDAAAGGFTGSFDGFRWHTQYRTTTSGTSITGTIATTSSTSLTAGAMLALVESSSNVTRVGTPAVIENEGTYTAETGSNRLAVFAVGAEGSTTSACETSDLSFGTVKAQLIRQRDTDSSTYAGMSVYVIPEASIPSGSQTVTATFVGSPTNSFIICLTLGDADQSIAFDGSTDNAVNSSAAELTWTLAINNSGGLGLCFAASSNSVAGISLSTADGWTEVLDAAEGAATLYWLGEKALTGASTTAGITPSASSSTALVAVAFRPLGIASTIAARAAAYYYN